VSFQEFQLDPTILSGIKAVGYTTPTPIQQQAIPSIMEGKDLLGLAQTGTGKTAAFALPILHHLVRNPGSRKIRVLVISPTRELAEQIHQACVGFAKDTRISSIAIYGGVSKIPQLKGLRRCPEIVVACPGRLLDLVGDGAIDLSGLEVLVLDEADTMCDMGFLPDVRRILNLVPSNRQTLLFSATMPEDIRKLTVNILKDPITVQVDASAPAKTVSHALYPVPESLKRGLLLALLEQTPTGRTLVFARTKHRTKRLALDLANHKYRVASLQGNLSQNRRQQSMDGFRDGKFDILVATDIAAHGIDVPELSHVINFDMPDTADAYTHRIGRTGRALQTGEAFTLAVPEDRPMVRVVERVLNAKIERRRLPGFNYGDFNPEAQFPQDRPSPSQVNGRQNGNNSGNHRPVTGQGMLRGPAARNSTGAPTIARGARPDFRRRSTGGQRKPA
jgi:ATP-dependent RNA helicase RhlE